MSPDAALHPMLFWLAGDLSGASFPTFALIILGLGLLLCRLLAPGFNILARGDQAAAALGLAVSPYRIILYLLSALFTATAVTLSGCIGFVGLIIPHLTRAITGFDHRLVLPIASLLGGCFLMTADTIARTWLSPVQLPVGILLAMIGIPLLCWLLQKNHG